MLLWCFLGTGTFSPPGAESWLVAGTAGWVPKGSARRYRDTARFKAFHTHASYSLRLNPHISEHEYLPVSI